MIALAARYFLRARRCNKESVCLWVGVYVCVTIEKVRHIVAVTLELRSMSFVSHKSSTITYYFCPFRKIWLAYPQPVHNICIAICTYHIQLHSNIRRIGRSVGRLPTVLLLVLSPSSAKLAQCVERWTSTPEARVQIRIAAIQRIHSRTYTVLWHKENSYALCGASGLKLRSRASRRYLTILNI